MRLLESAERLANIGCWEWFPGSDRIFWSANLYRILGIEPDEITPSLGFVLSRTHPDDKDRVESYAKLNLREPCPSPLEFRINPADRGVRYLRSTTIATHWDDRGPRRVAGAVQDVTDQLLDNRELAARVAVSRALAEWQAFEISGKRLLCGLAEALQFVFAALWLPNGGLLKSRLEWSDSSIDAAAFAAATQALCFPRGVGLLGRAWQEKKPIELGQFLSRRQGQLLDFSPLTPRELQVLPLASDGFSRSQIAARLTVSSATIATHMKHIFGRLGVRDRASAVATAIRLGLIE